MLTESEQIVKDAIDKVMRKSRVHWYKPIQIAEILFHHRTEKGWDLNDLESYRNLSKRWRDEVSIQLVGRKSTSSQKYQDNIFDKNAMPPRLLHQCASINKNGRGLVEAYIYKSFESQLSSVHEIYNYVKSTPAGKFFIQQFGFLISSSSRTSSEY